MMKIAICDDNENFLDIEEKIIASYMKKYEIAYQVDIFHCGEELIALKEDISSYQLIFLDVDMDEINGIETARKIREKSDVPIAFVTAFVTYSLEGYKVNAVRYILKKAVTLESSIYECLDLMVQKREEANEAAVWFEFREKRKKILLNELVYVESRRHYCYFYLWEEGKIAVYSLRGKLDDMEKQIAGYFFCRIHKSCIVNMRYIAEINRYYISLNLKEDMRLSISQTKYKDVKEAYIDFWGRMD